MGKVLCRCSHGAVNQASYIINRLKKSNYSAHHRDTEYTETFRKKACENDKNNRILVPWFMLFFLELFQRTHSVFSVFSVFSVPPW